MSEQRKYGEGIDEEVIKFMAIHYASLIVEDRLFKALKDRGIDAIYATHNEPARIEVFRVLLNEVHRRVHGNLYFDSSKVDLALHGILRENLKIKKGSGQEFEKSYHVGIDYVFLCEYPTRKNRQKVVVPLFIIGKSELENAKEVEIEGAVNEVLRYGGTPESVRIALENILKFTRIVLTRTVTSKNEEGCIVNEVGEIPVYSDIACGVLYAVYVDIPSMYEEVAGDSELAKLTISDWLVTLILLGMPMHQVNVASSDSPPERPRNGGLVNDIAREVRQRASEIIKGFGENFEKSVQEAERAARQRSREVKKQREKHLEEESEAIKRRRLGITI